MLISEEYREEQRSLHERIPEYGSASVHYAPLVCQLIDKFEVTEVLDYGCGKGRLGESLMMSPPSQTVSLQQYDPALPDVSDSPEPAQMVVCIDVLEHIEPDCLDAVLADLVRCSKHLLLTTVHTGPAVKMLSDGRNAHLIQKPTEWWLPKIWETGVSLLSFGKEDKGFWALWRSRHLGNSKQRSVIG